MRYRTPELRPMRTALATVLAGIILAGCAGAASPSATSEPSVSASATSSVTAPSREPISTPSPSPTPEPTAAASAVLGRLSVDQPADFVPDISCEGDIGPSDPVAIVRLKPSGPSDPVPQVLRNYADLSAPRTVCTFGGNTWNHDLIDARHVLISVGADHAVVDLPELTYHWFRLPAIEGGGSQLLTVSPDFDAVIWWKTVVEPPSRHLMITTASGDAEVTDLPELLDGRCGSPTDSNRADFQPDGKHYYVLDQIILNLNALVVAEGATAKLEIMPPEEADETGSGRDPATIPLFAVWSPVAEVLYYRLGDDVLRWTPDGGAELFLSDTEWFYPSITADGRYLAYVAESDLYLTDLTATPVQPTVIRPNVGRAAFVNDAQIWFEDASAGGCVSGEVQYRIYDVRDGSEAPSIILSVEEVWPGTSSNH